MRRRLGEAFVLLCWACALAGFLLPISNPDLFWHLSAARRMLETGSIPRADWLSFTMEGRPWFDFEWLTQLLWYGLLKMGGVRALWALKALLFTAAAAVFWRTLGLYKVSKEGGALALLAWSTALCTGNDLRPENFSMLFFAGEWHLLEKWRLKNKDSIGVANLAVVAASFAIWANLHAGFANGLLLLGVYAAAAWWRRGSKAGVMGLAAAAAGTLVNPFGARLYGVIAEHLFELKDLQEYILEWQEPSIINSWLAPFWVLFLVSFIVVLARFLKDRKVPAEHIAALCLFAWPAASHNRATLYFAMVAVPVTASALASWPALARGARWRLAAGGAAAALCLAFFGFKMAPELSLGQPYQSRFSPDAVAGFLKAQAPALGGRRLLNKWEWGGYLGWRLHPEYKVFVDGRYIFHSMLKPIHEATRTPEAYQAFLDRWGIDVVVHNRARQFFQDPFRRKDGREIVLLRPYYKFFLPTGRWAMVYWGTQGVVFVRRAAFPPAWVKENEFRLLRPDDFQAAALLVRDGAASWRDLAREVERFAALNPGLPEESGLREWLDSVRR